MPLSDSPSRAAKREGAAQSPSTASSSIEVREAAETDISAGSKAVGRNVATPASVAQTAPKELEDSGVKPGKAASGKWIVGVVLVVLLSAGGVLVLKPSRTGSVPERKADAASSVSTPPPAESQPTEQAAQTRLEGTEWKPLAADLVEASTRGDADKFQSTMLELKAMQKPISGDRKLARELNEHGLAALRNGDVSGAVELLSRAHTTDAADIEVSDNLGYALSKAGAHAEAEAQLMKVLAQAPERASAWANLAEASSHQGKNEQAVAAYVTAYELSRKPEVMLETLKKYVDNPEYEASKANLLSAIQRIEALR